MCNFMRRWLFGVFVWVWCKNVASCIARSMCVHISDSNEGVIIGWSVCWLSRVDKGMHFRTYTQGIKVFEI